MLRTLSTQAGPPSAPSIVPWLYACLTTHRPTISHYIEAPIPPAVRHAAIAVLDQLADGVPDTLCHADLSPPNVLHGRSRLWLIDPRGFLRGRGNWRS
ncbi:Ser/Thr protein kinase RdoA (MazF antagonist) [Pseudonocardia parietis]|uniref:Ser/Thr protein kinase RdoA (MazF antagonist) n=1 Tax=Pseudonocardia parietis TaxID=570936 RepID=A0ABS4VMN0_9PSEU|nr:Ser/Thr protein kinase RdoA (MazF antagonist) [Pseudonocardia parietis]